MSQHSENLKPNRQILRYTLLPEVIPRAHRSFASGFKLLAFLIANIFGAVRIFPKNHPYLRADSYKKFGLINVLAEGSRCVTWDRKHSDQILVYLAILTGFVILLMQFLILGSMVFTSIAVAGPPNDMITQTGSFDFFFEPKPNAEQDYALRFLDLVFGLRMPGDVGSFFNSCVGTAAVCQNHLGENLDPYIWPTKMHAGLHSILEFYNYMIIALAFAISFYYVVTLAAETTVHGSFWGMRGNKTWIPVRAIFFCALILPFYQGLNFGQFLVLDAAYFGTGLASNAWREANDVILNELAGPKDKLVAKLKEENFPSSMGMVHFMTMVKTCKYAEKGIRHTNSIDAYIVKDGISGGQNCKPLVGTSYEDALEFSNYGDIRIRFGERVLDANGDPVDCSAMPANMSLDYSFQSGFVIPSCGELTLTTEGPKELGEAVRDAYYNGVITFLWNDPTIDSFGKGFYEAAVDQTDPYKPDINQIRIRTDATTAQIESGINIGINNLLATDYFDIKDAMKKCGWVCAALYYNRIAEANGVMQSSAFAAPEITLWPELSEIVLAHRNMDNRMMDVCDMFSPVLPGREAVDFSQEVNLRTASVISNAHEYFCENGLMGADFSDGGSDAFRYTMTAMDGSPVKSFIIMMLGINGLFDMRQNTDVHPLAQLSLLGKGLVDSTIAMFGFSVIGTVGQPLGLEKIMGKSSTAVLNSLTGVATSIGMIALTIGFILYYVIPFLPFIYFFFAVVDWIKAIFEALVGVPLWALAHLRLDGEGIIGEAASAGYWLIFEIFSRPFFILVGFMASISLFMGSVKLLNDMFDLLVGNVGGYYAKEGVNVALGNASTYPGPYTIDNMRGPIDQFFYTVIYAIIVYMIGLSTFKLVDLIPNQILRWAGVGVQTFGDFAGDPAGQLISLIGTGVKTGAVVGGGLLGKVNRNVGGIKNDADPV